MKSTVEFLGKSYGHDKIRGVQAATNVSLTGRGLDVDEMIPAISTGPRHLGFWTHEPLPFCTRAGRRFVTTEQTALGSWSASNALRLLRGGSQYAILYPQSVARVGKLAYDISCVSVVGKLARLPHRGGVYNATTHTTAGALMREICGYRNGQPAAGITIYVAPEFESIILYGWLPYVSPTGENGAPTGDARDNLAQVLFAINASLRVDAQGVLRVENLPTAATATITDDDVYAQNARVVDEQPITAVTLLEHNYVVGSEPETLFEGTASAGQTIVFSAPMANLSWHTAAEPPVEMPITESNANYAVLSAGSGVLTGVPYLDTTREVTRAVSVSDTPNTERIEGATLVSLYNVSDCADKLAAYYACRKRIECDVRIGTEIAGDVVNIWDPFDELMRSACIESIAPMTLSNVLKGRVSALVGYTPWQTRPFTDVHQILTGSGTFTVPAGVTTLTLVLIGAGSGGAAGTKGTDGESVSGAWPNYAGNSPIQVAAGKGGKGGLGGFAGAAGKVLVIELSVTPGQTYSYNCGAKGVGGVDGVDGGDGGDGGRLNANEASDGKSGGDAGTHTGGAGGTGVWQPIGTDPDGPYKVSDAGAGGGGASGNGNGQAGGNGQRVPGATITGAKGGDGANAVTPAAKTVYGCGGDGANGSGAGGGAASFYLNEPAHNPYDVTYNAAGGKAGSAANGGDGAPGCIIAVYRVPAA